MASTGEAASELPTSQPGAISRDFQTMRLPRSFVMASPELACHRLALLVPRRFKLCCANCEDCKEKIQRLPCQDHLQVASPCSSGELAVPTVTWSMGPADSSDQICRCMLAARGRQTSASRSSIQR